MNTELIDVNGYKIHPDLLLVLSTREPRALKELQGEFSPTTGCGEGCASLIDAYTAYQRARLNVLELIDPAADNPGNALMITKAVAATLAVYIFG